MEEKRKKVEQRKRRAFESYSEECEACKVSLFERKGGKQKTRCETCRHVSTPTRLRTLPLEDAVCV